MGTAREPKKPQDSNKAMRQCEKRLESIIEISSDGYWEQDENYRFTLIRGGLLEKSGIDPKNYLGTARWDHGAVPVGDDGSWDKHKAVLEARKPFTDFLFKRANSQGEVRIISTSGQPVFDEQGRYRGYRGIARDITARRRDEQLLALEHSVNRCLAEAESASGALQAAMRAVCETEGWECGRYFRVDEAAGVLRFAEAWGVPGAAVEHYIARSHHISYTPGEGLSGRVWQSGEPLWVSDIHKDARVAQSALAREAGMRGAFVFPVVSEGKTIGVLAFTSREIRHPEARLLEAIRAVGSQIGQFLQRKRAEEERRRFRAAIDLSADSIFLIDRATMRFIDVNTTACEEFGYTREELLETGPHHLSGRSREETERSYDELISGFSQARVHEIPLRRKDRSVMPGEVYRRAISSPEGHTIVATVHNITQRKLAEAALRESEERFRSLAALSSDMYWEQNDQYRFTSLTGVGSQVYQKTAKLIVDKKRWEQNYINMTPDDWAAHIAALEARQPFHDLELCRLDESGKKIWVSVSGEPVFDESGAFTGYRGVGKDITQRKLAEAALRESEERFRSLAALSSDMFWEQDDQHRLTKLSGKNPAWVGDSRARLIGKRRWDLHFLNMSEADWAAHRAELEARQPFHDLELCRLDESGKKIWVSVSGEPVFDPSGAFTGYRGVGKDITGRKQDEERIQYLANHDALTSLPNRARFGYTLNLALQSARRYHRNFAVLFIDLDRFKIINDTLGHEAGDKLLQEMGTRLSRTVRSSDMVARLGGDEFVVLIQEVSEAQQVEPVARKILSAVIKPMVIQAQECSVTASIGICMYPSDAQDEPSLMKNADIAMYRAKEEGKNTYKFYSEKINVHSLERMALETSLRRGLERSEFFLHYQAKLNLQTGQITGVEALVRWQHPELGMVPPGQFIPLAEETGLIVPIGRWVLNTACAQNVAWQREGLPPLRMAVNLSARQFADADLLKDIAAALEESGMKAELLELELTESMVMQNVERADKVLAAIKRIGVRLAIDDFGVGYSSLSHLKRFPIDTLKVDRSFIRDIPQDSDDKAITEAIIAMGKSLNLTVVAEGVETLEQETFLRDHACDETQGYYFSRPIAGDQFVELLRRRLESSK